MSIIELGMSIIESFPGIIEIFLSKAYMGIAL